MDREQLGRVAHGATYRHLDFPPGYYAADGAYSWELLSDQVRSLYCAAAEAVRDAVLAEDEYVGLLEAVAKAAEPCAVSATLARALGDLGAYRARKRQEVPCE